MKNCLMSSSYNWLGMLGLGISANKSADKSSLQDRNKQQRSFFLICFPVKYSDRLVTTVLTVFNSWFLKVLESVWLLLLFSTFLDTLDLFYTTHSSSLCFLTLFELTKILALEKVQRRASYLALGRRQGNVEYEDHFKILNWPTLEKHRHYISL